jgi:hypothetical protein
MTQYRVQAIHAGSDAQVAALAQAVQTEVANIGLHQSVEVSVEAAALPAAPTVAVFFGSQAAAIDASCIAAAEAAVADVVTVLPVVDNLGRFRELVPAVLHPINGMEWTDDSAAERLARRALEELGIEERQRKAFITHKRDDGLMAAEQLFDHLSHHGFRPFVDRFSVPSGADIQARIADELEDYAFLLVLETPLAHESDWVFDEVDYALTHLMGLHIVRWPGDVEVVPATSRLPRQQLVAADLTTVHGFDVLVPDALDRVLEEIEAAHAYSMVRRRRNLLRSVEDAAEAAGHPCTPLGAWRLLVEEAGRRDVVEVTGRLPMVQDLHGLDRSVDANDGDQGVLIHAARSLRPDRAELLNWAVGGRPLTFVPENAIGGYW